MSEDIFAPPVTEEAEAVAFDAGRMTINLNTRSKVAIRRIMARTAWGKGDTVSRSLPLLDRVTQEIFEHDATVTITRADGTVFQIALF
jgi:hypothetical protein